MSTLEVRGIIAVVVGVIALIVCLIFRGSPYAVIFGFAALILMLGGARVWRRERRTRRGIQGRG